MLKLYKIPGCYVFGFFGRFGSGKSLGMVEQALIVADKYHLKVVANFPLNNKAIRKYCKLKKLNWFYANGRVINVDHVNKLFAYTESVLLLDEAGVELFSRGFKDTNRKFILDRLFRIRHFGNFLFYTCQDIDQVDKQFRDRTHTLIFCKGFQRFSVEKRRPILLSRQQFALDIDRYENWKETGKGKLIRTMFLSEFRFTISPLVLKNTVKEIIGFIGFLGFLKKCLGQSRTKAIKMSKNLKQYSFYYQNLFAITELINSLPNHWRFWREYHYQPPAEYLLFKCFQSYQKPSFEGGRKHDYIEYDPRDDLDNQFAKNGNPKSVDDLLDW